MSGQSKSMVSLILSDICVLELYFIQYKNINEYVLSKTFHES
jgi:hypothetical protein